MTRKPAAPANLRNGLKWRDGLPRWEPSPANRACGFQGASLTTAEGKWMDRGAATTAADARTLWASIVRAAMRDDDAGGKARGQLRAALEALPPMPNEPDAANRRRLVADLIERGRAVLEDREPDVGESLRHGPRTGAALVAAYFADPSAMRRLAPATLEQYRTQAKKFAERFGSIRIDEITPGKLLAWHEAMEEQVSRSTANVAIGTAGAMFQWALLQDPPWLTSTPVQRLRLPRAEGRRVYWTMDQERAFVDWCDAHGFPDVADCVTLCLWTGARQIDVCAANLEDLSRDAWRYIPIKTQKRKLEALPGLLPPVKRRVERRRKEAAAAGLDHLNGTPMLWHPMNRRHTSETIGERFRDARDLAAGSKGLRENFAELRLGDCRDTCITRLFDADVGLTRITAWTGHAVASAETILREHYVSLREAGAMADAAKLNAWAEREGVSLSA